jgi:hypothetical protein
LLLSNGLRAELQRGQEHHGLAINGESVLAIFMAVGEALGGELDAAISTELLSYSMKNSSGL